MSIRVFFTSVSSSVEMKKKQERIFSVLTSKHIPFVAVDISQNPDDRQLMRKIAGDPKALPPQICKGDAYCGDFTSFENAIEEERLEAFLKL